MLKRTILSAMFLAGSILPFIANLVVFMLIIQRKQLQQVRFYIIANLLLADIGFMTAHFLKATIDLYDNQGGENNSFVRAAIFCVITYAAYLNSILTTGLLAMDRYIAVIYTFHYETVLTKRRIIFVLSILWLLSAVTPTVLIKVSGPTFKGTYRKLIVSLIFFRLIVSLVLLVLSKYTHYIKKNLWKLLLRGKTILAWSRKNLINLKG